MKRNRKLQLEVLLFSNILVFLGTLYLERNVWNFEEEKRVVSHQTCQWKDTMPLLEKERLNPIYLDNGIQAYQCLYGNTLLSDTNSIEYHAYVSGINPCLDSIEFIFHERRKIPLKIKRQPWHLTLGVGYGIGYDNHQWYTHPYVGIQLGYDINWDWFTR
ncbi:hypothetical protein N9251_00020 [Gammaproteobacteria bacterium]|nr:hypothetical protein [Gammaproteobacteria bacterium]